jgi:hypothetical protein
MNTAPRVLGPASRRPWLVATFIAFSVGGAIAGGLLRFLEQPYYETAVSAAEAAFVQAISLGASEATFGAVLGTAQWLVLRRAVRASWWVPATCLGWAIAGSVGGFLAGGSVSTIGPDEGPVPPVVATLVGYPVVAASLVGPQWLILRGQVDGARAWPIRSLFGLLLGLAIGFAIVTTILVNVIHWLEPTDFPSAKVFVLIGSIAGVVYGAVTWSALVELRQRLAPVTVPASGPQQRMERVERR